MDNGAAETFLDRLARASDEHDLDALAACFAHDYVNETPSHPARGFRGREQVRRNWDQIFTHVPDLRTTVLRRATLGDETWSEWEMRGTRRDGTPHHLRGVIIFSVRDGTATWGRLYLEPVDESEAGVNEAVRDQVVR